MKGKDFFIMRKIMVNYDIRSHGLVEFSQHSRISFNRVGYINPQFEKKPGLIEFLFCVAIIINKAICSLILTAITHPSKVSYG